MIGAPPSPADIALTWVARFRSLLAGTAQVREDDLLAEKHWWRDLLMVDWDLRTEHGSRGFCLFLDLARRRGLSVDDPEGEAVLVEGPQGSWVEAVFALHTRTTYGRALVRLVEHPPGSGQWRAWTLCTAAEGLHDVAERVDAQRPWGGRIDAPDPGALTDEDTPQVLVVGAGQAGLSIAARLQALGVSTTVVERLARVGDGWRQRYDALTLHDPVWGDHLPYLRFPPTWPLYTPKDLLADWLELYARALRLNVLCSATITACTFDEARPGWDVHIVRADGSQALLRPAHLVVATGATGSLPYRPLFENEGAFEGPVLHSSEYRRPDALAGRRVLVVGTGNSGHDIAHDLATTGAEVTMLQRSATYVTSATNVQTLISALYGDDPSGIDDADFRSASFPYRATAQLQRATTEAFAGLDRPLLDGLAAAGFTLTSGPEGRGLTALFSERGGGYYLDVGAAALIADGRISVRQGVIDRLESDRVVLGDGSSIAADAIVLATGFRSMADSAATIVGADIAAATDPAWGLDADGEFRSLWRSTSHPRLFFAGGNLSMCRYFSKFLALHIAAIESALVDP